MFRWCLIRCVVGGVSGLVSDIYSVKESHLGNESGGVCSFCGLVGALALCSNSDWCRFRPTVLLF